MLKKKPIYVYSSCVYFKMYIFYQSCINSINMSLENMIFKLQRFLILILIEFYYSNILVMTPTKV